MGPDDALRLADWVGGLFAETTPQQVAFLADEFAPFDAAVVEQEVTRYRRHFEALNVANLLRRLADAHAKRNLRAAPRAEREQVDAAWKRHEADLSRLSDDELKSHKAAILDENPALRPFLADKDPRRSVVLQSLILDRRLKNSRV